MLGERRPSTRLAAALGLVLLAASGCASSGPRVDTSQWPLVGLGYAALRVPPGMVASERRNRTCFAGLCGYEYVEDEGEDAWRESVEELCAHQRSANKGESQSECSLESPCYVDVRSPRPGQQVASYTDVDFDLLDNRLLIRGSERTLLFEGSATASDPRRSARLRQQIAQLGQSWIDDPTCEPNQALMISGAFARPPETGDHFVLDLESPNGARQVGLDIRIVHEPDPDLKLRRYLRRDRAFQFFFIRVAWSSVHPNRATA